MTRGRNCTPALPSCRSMPPRLPFLFKHLLDATPAELPVIRDALQTPPIHPGPEALVSSRFRQAGRSERAPGGECPRRL